MENKISKNTSFYIIGGGGVNLESGSPVCREIQENLNEKGIKYYNIDGQEKVNGELVVRPPSRQFEVGVELLENDSSEYKVFIAQCIGAVAAKNLLKYSDKNQINGFLSIFAPPLPSPSQTLENPKSASRRANNKMKTSIFPKDDYANFNRREIVEISLIPEYLTDSKNETEYRDELKSFIKLGKAVLFSLEKDWNLESIKASKQLRNELMEEKNYHFDNIVEIKGCGHSLDPKSDQAKSQAEDAGFVVDKTIECLEEYYKLNPKDQ